MTAHFQGVTCEFGQGTGSKKIRITDGFTLRMRGSEAMTRATDFDALQDKIMRDTYLSVLRETRRHLDELVMKAVESIGIEIDEIAEALDLPPSIVSKIAFGA
jgi:hypothetical protein